MNAGEIENLRKHAAKMQAEADYFIACRKRLEKWAYFGDPANDPAEDARAIAAIKGLDHVIARANAAKRKAIDELAELDAGWKDDALAGFVG